MMAAGDYRSCDVCGGKAFYDANLNYEIGDKVDGKWVYSDTPYRIAGAVICTNCAKTHKTVIVALTEAK